jgi:hypothetical protein
MSEHQKALPSPIHMSKDRSPAHSALDLSRRQVVMNTAVTAATLATSTVVAAPVLALSHVANLDPVFAAIEAHREASTEWLRHVKIEGELDAIIPIEKMQNYSVDDRDNPEVGKDDDPRWTAAHKEYWAASDRLDDASLALIDVVPSSVAGVTALLDYCAETQAKMEGSLLPDTLEDDDDSAVSKSFGAPYLYFVCRNAVVALRRLSEVTK